MICPETGRWRAWLDGEVEQARPLEDHLATCPACADRVAGLRHAARLAGGAVAVLAPPALPSTDTLERTRQQLRLRQARPVGPPGPATLRPATLRPPMLWPPMIWREHGTMVAIRTISRWRLATAGLAAALALAFFLGTSAGQSAAAQFLAQFRSQQFTAIPIDTARARNPFAELERLGTVRGDRPLSRGEEVPSLAEASRRVGFTLKQPDASALPSGVDRAPTIRVTAAGEQRFTFDRAKARAYFEQSGSPNVDLPAKFDGATLVVRLPAAGLLEYRSTGSGPGLMIGQSGELEVGVEGNVSLDELRDFLISLPNVPPATAERLRSIRDWQNTLPIPVPSDRIRWQDTTIAGGQGLLLADTSGALNAAIWQRDGRVYGVAGSIKQDELRRVADSLR